MLYGGDQGQLRTYKPIDHLLTIAGALVVTGVEVTIGGEPQSAELEQQIAQECATLGVRTMTPPLRHGSRLAAGCVLLIAVHSYR